MARDKTDKTDKTPVETQAPNEWGIPDWRDAAAYDDVKTWTFYRWRWEFFRRRTDLRAYFVEHSKATYQANIDYRRHVLTHAPTLAPHYQTKSLKPCQAGFTANCDVQTAKKFGLSGIPNPRIGEQPWHLLLPNTSDGWEKMMWGSPEQARSVSLEAHQVGFAFSLDKPIIPQIEAAKRVLLDMQKERHGKASKRIRQPKLWLGYLRTLDARADDPSESWAELAHKLYGYGLLDRRKDPGGGYCEPPGQAARDKWKAADALRFNF